VEDTRPADDQEHRPDPHGEVGIMTTVSATLQSRTQRLRAAGLPVEEFVPGVLAT